VLEAFTDRLTKLGVLARRDIPSLTKYQIILARDQYRKNPSSQHMGTHQGIIEGDFALCISLYHGYELLLQMGIRSLFIYLWGIMDGSKGLTRTKNELGRNEDFVKLYQQLRNMFADTALAPVNGSVYQVPEKKKEFIYSHPKLRKLEEIVIEHFKSWKKGCSQGGKSESPCGDTRVMIFSSFRDSVQEIAEMLSRLSPTVRAMTFVGHSTGKSTKGFTQKEQLEVVKRFREGGYNTLVSTCVGEEGLDIGEVDLIICFDAQKSPIRLVQRMGRTGRRRQGRIVVILAQGREERTYNQSQCNKRSINKAISGNKALHFYQHSPRMVPEGINPKMHKMFITAEKYEPSNCRKLPKERRSSSLQHKSALFACVAGQKQMNSRESWALTPEEYKIWDRLYRIKESDGIKQPVLPRSQFETLGNLEETSKHEEGETHELSLNEWSIWQSCPLPTAMVDHSDYCHHFISVMDMIEQMRHQQGDCSYELELQPHLHLEDVHVPGKKSHHTVANSTCDQRAHSSRNVGHTSKMNSLSPGTADNESEFFAIFKITKPKAPKRTSAFSVEMPVLPADPLASPSGRSLAVAEHTEQGSENKEELEVTFDLNACIDVCDSSESTEIPDSAATKEIKPAKEASRTLGVNQEDSGYETSPVSSDLFYLPEPYVDPFVPVRPREESPGLKQPLSPVQRLLAQSPPPLSELDDLDKVMRSEETTCPVPGAVCDGDSEALQDSVLPPASEPGRSLLLFENPNLKGPREFCTSGSPSLAKTVPSPEAALGALEEHPWNESFDSLFDAEFTETQEDTSAVSHTLTDNPSNELFVQKDVDIWNQKVVLDEEQSIHLFEDDQVDDTVPGRCSVSNKPPERSGPRDSALRPGAGQGSRGCPTEVSCVDATKEQHQSSKAMETPGVSEQGLEDDDLYDCSQELFSVTFDLGFAIEGCDSDTSEENTNPINISKSNSTLGSHAGGKSTEARTAFLRDNSRMETSPEQDCRTLERRDNSTPLSFQGRDMNAREGTEDISAAVPFLESGGRRTGRRSPEALSLALFTPRSRKGMNVKAIKRIPRKVFNGAREETPEVPLADKIDENPCGQTFRSSAMDALDSPLGRTADLEDTNLCRSHVCPAAGPSSDSEEEIIFQRKARRKKNVLKSPDGMDQSDLESPVHVGKRQHPLILVKLKEEQQEQLNSLEQNPLQTCQAAKGQEQFYIQAARQFLEEEAELSQQDAEGVSSDESDGAESELSSSLAQFLNDDVEVTQALNDTEMRGVYLKSVHSPALGNRYKMVHREFNSSAIFSQIPEQDSAYAEDSFCVGDGEEETCRQSESSEDEVCVNFDLLNNESFTSGRNQYVTRRRRRLNQARLEQNSVPEQRRKPSRIIVLSDSSEEETAVSKEKPRKPDCSRAELPMSLPSAPSAQHKDTAGAATAPQAVQKQREVLQGLEVTGSETLDFHPEPPARTTCFPPAVPSSGSGKADLQARKSLCDVQHPQVRNSWKNTHGSTSGPGHPAATKPSSATAQLPREAVEKSPSLCILADSREICSGAEVISCLKAAHGVKVQVCSLGSSDYIVSSCLAVERMFLSELLSPGNRGKVSQRLQRLQGLFQRVCVIVETDRVRPGETSRFLQRTQHYDAVLSALVQAGIRVLFSSGQEDSAALLKDLAVVEQRKNCAICVPTEVEGPWRDRLSFYLSIPNLSYVAALNLCHAFHSLRDMVNSSPLALAKAAQVSLQKAEEIHHHLHYSFDPQLLPEHLCPKGKGPAAPKS
ncbi:Fanconi anemia group M protein, partial [Acanthisitta chloris]